jgi:hypothetical protein
MEAAYRVVDGARTYLLVASSSILMGILFLVSFHLPVPLFLIAISKCAQNTDTDYHSSSSASSW